MNEKYANDMEHALLGLTAHPLRHVWVKQAEPPIHMWLVYSVYLLTADRVGRGRGIRGVLQDAQLMTHESSRRAEPRFLYV